MDTSFANLGRQIDPRTGSSDRTHRHQYGLDICFGAQRVARRQACQEPIAQIIQGGRVAQATIAMRGPAGDLEGFDRGFLAWLQPTEHRVRHSPSSPPILAVLGFDVGEDGFERLRHALRGTMRNVELRADIVEADPMASAGGHVRQPDQILSFRERHVAILTANHVRY